MYYSKEGDSKEFYIIGEDELKDGINDAREYEKNIIPIKLEAKENNLLESNGNYLEHDEEILSLTKELYEIKGQLNWLKVKNDILESKLKKIIGKNEGIKDIASWKSVSRQDFNKSRFKNEYPELHAEFCEDKKVRTFKLLF